MIWPWSEIARWKELAERYERRWDESLQFSKIIECEYLKLYATVRGAHKGIWRLKQKIKRLEAKLCEKKMEVK